MDYICVPRGSNLDIKEKAPVCPDLRTGQWRWQSGNYIIICLFST